MSAGEGSSNVAKQFTFEKMLGNRGAVDGDKRPRGTGTQIVDGARRQFLAGTAFTGNEHGGVGCGDPMDNLLNFFN